MPDEIDARTALAYSLIDPLDVDSIIAAWSNGDASGYVIRRKSGGFSYVSRRYENGKTTITIDKFKVEPIHLYDRAVDWKSGAALDDLNNALRNAPQVAITDHDGGWRKVGGKNTNERARQSVIPVVIPHS